MKFCKACGTLYDENVGECPTCVGAQLQRDDTDFNVTDQNMPPEEVARKRKKDWIWLALGVPGMIALFYGVFALAKALMR